MSELLEEVSSLVWIDLCAPDVAQLQLVADELGLHTLAVEDAITGRQRPKFSRYTGHYFLTAYAVRLDRETGELVTAEIATFITPSAPVDRPQGQRVPHGGTGRGGGTTKPTWPSTASARSFTGCSTTWSTDTSMPSSPSTTRSASSRICCSTIASPTSSFSAGALSTSGGSCYRRARS